MNRRVFLALLPLPWLAGWLKPEPGMATTSLDLPETLLPVYHGDGAGHSFVCRKPEGVLLLRENMRIDIYGRLPWWRRLRNKGIGEPPPPPKITAIDHENRIVTYE